MCHKCGSKARTKQKGKQANERNWVRINKWKKEITNSRMNDDIQISKSATEKTNYWMNAHCNEEMKSYERKFYG